MSDFINNTKALEDAFFLAEDRVLIEKLAHLRKMKETREGLAAVSGISNPELLEKLISLGIQTETVASLAVVPLIEVAWADGQVDEKEKAAILKCLEAPQFPQSIDKALVERWLVRHPGPQLLDAWIHYSQSLAQKLTAAEKSAMKTDLLSHAQYVAAASGGILGLGGISPAEKAVLEKLSAAWN